jgi:toxin ParE1/3/4
MQIIWLDPAENDLAELVRYVGQRNTRAARRMNDAIRSRVQLLADQPDLGRASRTEGIRQLVIARTPYLVTYSVRQDLNTVFILRVLHGARRWPDDLRPS